MYSIIKICVCARVYLTHTQINTCNNRQTGEYTNVCGQCRRLPSSYVSGWPCTAAVWRSQTQPRRWGVLIFGRSAARCNILRHSATYCHTLQHTAAHCNTLQPSATHCNSLNVTPINGSCHTYEWVVCASVTQMTHSYVWMNVRLSQIWLIRMCAWCSAYDSFMSRT